ncbi:MAG TPA: diguanylate cyclase [Gemmatimonadales bacterium]|nr:diguanylate cyclase [Gemmatimonadales bacterium]
MIGARLAKLRAQLQELWAPPDSYLLDAGTSAELIIAQVRLGLTSVLLLVPLVNLAVSSSGERGGHLAGLALTAVAVVIAVIAYRMVQKGHREQWLPLATSLMDVSLVSFALLIWSLVGDPHQAVNSKVTFELYFLAIGATCLRYDLRVTVITGFVAMLEYGVVLLVVAFQDLDATRYAPWVYGRFYWSDQASRLILLTLHTILCTMIVLRLQRHRRLSNSDRLTGLFNRAYFEDFLAAEVRRSRRYSRSFAVAMVDIDRFKNFNDTYGHAAGDLALKAVATTIQRALRRSDLVARYGGEEMVLVMPETTLAAARKRLEIVREAVAAEMIPIPKRTEQVRITVSAGVACWPVDGEDPDDLLHIADARLFHAKALGRNRVVASSVAAASV